MLGTGVTDDQHVLREEMKRSKSTKSSGPGLKAIKGINLKQTPHQTPYSKESFGGSLRDDISI